LSHSLTKEFIVTVSIFYFPYEFVNWSKLSYKCSLLAKDPWRNRLFFSPSPIVGLFSNEDIRMGFIPPYSKRLFELASSGSYPRLKQCEIHVGSEDWQSNPQNVIAFADLLDISVSVVKDEGHSLSKQYVSVQLDRWI
jgi:hypothetical protein